MANRYAAVLFDLLTGLLDSWSLWHSVAGSADRGRDWRLRYLELTYAAGRYRMYETLLQEAAAFVNLPSSATDALLSRWDELQPWPEVTSVLSMLRTLPIGVVTNCSEALSTRAVARLNNRMNVIVSAERAGAYKPDPRPYRLALEELGIEAGRVLFVAGSPGDIVGASHMGMAVYWHNRFGLVNDVAAARALAVHQSLDPVVAYVIGAVH